MILVIHIWISVWIIYFTILATEKYSVAMYYLGSESTLTACWQCWSSCFVGQQLSIHMASQLVRSLQAGAVDVGTIDVAGDSVDLILVLWLIGSWVFHSV